MKSAMDEIEEAGEPTTDSSKKTSASKQRITGLAAGFAAAIGYTLANMALRQMAKPDDFDWAVWVTANKAVPATLLTWGLVLCNYARGKTAFPPRKLLLPLILTGFVMQFIGNLMFQYALGEIGLAMTVPLTFALLLISGAVFSRMYLGEPITIRTLLALTVLMIAVTILSLGASEASDAMTQESVTMVNNTPETVVAGKETTTSQFIFGILAAMLSGAAYGSCGVVIRKNVRDLPVSATLVLISTTGVIAVGAFSLCRLSVTELLATTPEEMGTMFLAGVFNAGAFYAIGVAYRHLNVTQVNLINTSQIAMATLVGILFFTEPITPWLLIGVVMTVFGLFLIDKH